MPAHPGTGLQQLKKVDVAVVDNTSKLHRSTTAVYRTDRQALSTARFCCVGQLATQIHTHTHTHLTGVHG